MKRKVTIHRLTIPIIALTSPAVKPAHAPDLARKVKKPASVRHRMSDIEKLRFNQACEAPCQFIKLLMRTNTMWMAPRIAPKINPFRMAGSFAKLVMVSSFLPKIFTFLDLIAVKCLALPEGFIVGGQFTAQWLIFSLTQRVACLN